MNVDPFYPLKYILCWPHYVYNNKSALIHNGELKLIRQQQIHGKFELILHQKQNSDQNQECVRRRKMTKKWQQ